MSVSLNGNVSQVNNTKKNLVSKKTDNSKKTPYLQKQKSQLAQV